MMMYAKSFMGVLVVIGWLSLSFNHIVRYNLPVDLKMKNISLDSIDPFEDQMILVEGGTFLMGGPGSISDEEAKWREKPQHKATVKDFYLSKYEVTQAQWHSVMGIDPTDQIKRGADYPVSTMSWQQVQDFLAILNKKTGKKYRLPSEMEWEYAARGGKYSKGYKYAGSNVVDEVAWHARNASYKVHPVGQKKENELGFFDMTGNLMEWTQDLAKSYADPNKLLDPETHRVIRGGSFVDKEGESRVYSRDFEELTARQGLIGFRLAL